MLNGVLFNMMETPSQWVDSDWTMSFLYKVYFFSGMVSLFEPHTLCSTRDKGSNLQVLGKGLAPRETTNSVFFSQEPVETIEVSRIS